MSYLPNDTYKKNDTSFDSWGKPKTVIDYTLFHGTFTHEVHNFLWKISEDTIKLPKTSLSTRVVSDEGTLSVKSGSVASNTATLQSKRSPKYQPNRGHLFSTAVSLPNTTANGIREWGLFNIENGVFFRLKPDGKLYAVIRSKSVEVYEQEIVANFNIPFDSLICDIGFQWRGFGDFYFYIKNPNNREIELVHTILKEDLPVGEVSISNPALPVSFRSQNITEEVEIRCGCVDVTSEGGSSANRVPSQKSVGNAGVTLLASTENPILAIKINDTFNGKINTRDTILSRVNYSCNNESIMNIYVTSDASAFTGTTWTNVGEYDNIQSSIDGDISFTNNVNVENIYSIRVEQDTAFKIENPDEHGELYLTAGDYIVVTGDASAGNKVWATLEWSEEI